MDVRTAYDGWAGSYDAAPNRTRDLDAALIRALPYAWEALDVVEIGCGTGKNSVWLAPRCRSLVGLDFSAGMLAVARERLPDVRFVEADVTRPWPLPDASADLVLADLVLEHVADLGPPLAEAARVLRPGGHLRLCELHPFRQARGSRAHYLRGDERIDVPVAIHTVSELIGSCLAAGLSIAAVGEHAAEGDDPADPRLITLVASRAPPPAPPAAR